LPMSWRRWRAGTMPLLDTPTARIGTSLVAGAGGGFVGVHAVLANPGPRGRGGGSGFAKKLRPGLPQDRFPITIPAAVLGAVALGDDTRRDRGRTLGPAYTLSLLVSWCLVALAGYLAWTVFHLPVPAHRFLAFALAVPLLGILGVL